MPRGGARKGAGRPKSKDDESLTVRVMVRLKKKTMEKITSMAIEEGLTPSALIRRAIEDML